MSDLTEPSTNVVKSATEPANLSAQGEFYEWLMNEPAPGELHVPAPQQSEYAAALRFTGTGQEYFRIWVVNTLLTLLTLGVYSAWAKVRKAGYFARNTWLLNDCFDFRADPWAILRGRVIAVGLLVFYSFAFDFSLTAGLVATCLLVGLGPLLFMSAARFKLHNTRWRGLRFGLDTSVRQAYGAVLGVAMLWVSTSVAAAFLAPGSAWYALLSALPSLGWPWMHHRLKAFQHGRVRFGQYRSEFEPALLRFYGVYLRASLLMILAGVLVFLASSLIGKFGQVEWLRGYGGVITGAISALMVYLAGWPYVAARIQAVVWGNTRLGPLSFETRIALETLWPLAVKNLVLLILTAGLYWPFAAIAWARYRIECMTVHSSVPLEALGHDTLASSSPGAAGEGAMDMFGVDLGW